VTAAYGGDTARAIALANSHEAALDLHGQRDGDRMVHRPSQSGYFLVSCALAPARDMHSNRRDRGRADRASVRHGGSPCASHGTDRSLAYGSCVGLVIEYSILTVASGRRHRRVVPEFALPPRGGGHDGGCDNVLMGEGLLREMPFYEAAPSPISSSPKHRLSSLPPHPNSGLPDSAC